HLVAAQPARKLNLDTLGAGVDRGVGLHLHHPPEARPPLELLSDALRDDLGVGVGVGDLDATDRDVAAGQLLKVARELVDLSALGADDQPRPGRLDDDLQLLAGPLNMDVADGGERRLAVEPPIAVPADLLVLHQQLAVQRLGGVPPALMRLGDADAEPEWMYFLSHVALVALQGGPWPRRLSCLAFHRSSTVTVMWLVRFRIGCA